MSYSRSYVEVVGLGTESGKSPLLVLDNKKDKMPKPPQNTSVSSLYLSLSLSEGQFTFILPLFKLLTFSSFLFSSSYVVGFMNLHC